MTDSSTRIHAVIDDEAIATRVKAIALALDESVDWHRSKLIDTSLKALDHPNTDAVVLYAHLDGNPPKTVLEEWFSKAPLVPTVVLFDKDDRRSILPAMELGATGYAVVNEQLEVLLPVILGQATLVGQAQRESSRLQFDSLLTFCRDAILIVDTNTREILSANSQAIELYRYREGSLVGMCVDDLLVPENGRKLDFIEGEQKHQTKDGEIRFVDVTIAPHPHGRRDRLVVSVKDLTDQKQREEEVRFLQEFNSQILDSLPFAITVKTENHRVTYQNQLARSTFGARIGEPFELELMKSEPADNPGISQQEQTSEILWKEEPYSLNVMHIDDNATGESLIVELAQNISYQKRIQNELIQAQRMEAVGNLAGGIAHDFNNLLSGILGYANLIQAIEEENDQIVQYSKIIEETCIRASELTQQLLQFARSKSKLNEKFDLNAIVRYAAKLLRHSGNKEIQLTHKLTSKTLMMTGDPAQIQQMIVNLGLNAYQSMTEGQITLSTRKITIEEGALTHGKKLKPGQYAAFELHDTGRAMDSESIRTIFDPAVSDTVHGEPVGLSMSVAYAIAHSHGGLITIESKKKEGNTLTVYLQLMEEILTERSNTQSDTEEMVRGSETILIVDDEDVIRNLMLTSLTRFGYRVLVASGAEEGVRLYTMFQDEINLVMLDVGLPKIDGIRVFHALRSVNPKAKVIFFTGGDNQDRLDKVLKEDGVEFVSKPISLKALMRKIRESLDTDF